MQQFADAAWRKVRDKSTGLFDFPQERNVEVLNQAAMIRVLSDLARNPADFADPSRRGAQIGAYHMVVGVALLPASIIAGRLYEWNQAAPFLVGATTAVVTSNPHAAAPRTTIPACSMRPRFKSGMRNSIAK